MTTLYAVLASVALGVLLGLFFGSWIAGALLATMYVLSAVVPGLDDWFTGD